MTTLKTLFALLILSCAIFAQTASLENGQKQLQAKDWPGAQTTFTAITTKDPGNKQAWFFLGQSLQEQGKQPEALQAFEKATGVEAALANRLLFRTARAQAALGQKDKAFETLERLVHEGFTSSQLIESGPDFASLKSDPRFAKLLESIESGKHPCEHDPRYRAFDFWVGEWEVRPTGQPNGPPQRSSIQRILGSCVIFENYTFNGGEYEGKSFNIFDVNDGHWHQVYVDSGGTFHEWQGEVRDNVMYYVGANLAAGGGRTWDKITYFKLPNGHVRHLSERSTDGGKTWNAYFDGDYSPVSK